MFRKVILFISMSLDGYIAEKDGSVDFLSIEQKELDNTYEEFYKNVDTVVLGYSTYDQIVRELSPNHYPYQDSHSFVFSHRKLRSSSDITFLDEDVVEAVKKLRSVKGKDIWIVGGASIIAPLIKENMIDEYIIAVIPKLIGHGIPLFKENDHKLNLELKDTYSVNDIVYLKYKKQS